MNHEEEPIDLGTASEVTRGGAGMLPDFVREMAELGLSDE